MAHRSGGRGTYRLDRTFPGVGRVVAATGTNRVRVFDSINTMIGLLFETGRLDVLRRIQDHSLHPMVAYAEWKDTGTIRRASLGPSVRAMLDWLTVARIGEDARYGYGAQLRRMIREHPHAPVTELPDILRGYRLTLPPRSFGVLRTATLAYLRDTVGRRADVYGAVQDILPVYVVPQPQHPFTVADMVALKLPQPHLGMAWTLFTTGMNPKEYFSGKWEAVHGARQMGDLGPQNGVNALSVNEVHRARMEASGIHIHGTKRAGRERIVPLLMEPVLPTVTVRWFRPVLKKASPGHVLYDLRRGYGHLLEAAGIPGSRIRAYLGHGARTVTDVYLKHGVVPHLAEDAARVRALLPRNVWKARTA